MVKKKMDKNLQYALIFVVIALTGIFLVDPTFKPNEVVQGSWDITDQAIAKGYQQFLVEESDFDFSHPEIQAKARDIKQSTSSAEDAVRATMKFVASNTKYSSAMTVQQCYNEKASTVLQTRTGDCVSMSRLVTALLRAQGVPARTMGGCLSLNKRCTPLFSSVSGLEAQVTPMMEGDFKKRGFLHEWVEVWTPSEGWFIVEATSGQKYDLGCFTYLEYGYDSNNRNRCVITDRSFWQECAGY